jgi:hypothetical protein
MKRKLRWYDQYPKLAKSLESLNGLEEIRRDEIISGIMLLIKRNAPNLLERYVLDFPLDLQRRRWYDKDPYLWLIFNGLQYASTSLLEKVTMLLAKVLVRKPTPKSRKPGGKKTAKKKR